MVQKFRTENFTQRPPLPLVVPVAMWPWVRAMFVDQLLGGGKLPSLPWAETVDTSALLVATLPLWLPLLAWTFLALAGFVWRLTKARGGLLATLVAPWLLQRGGRWLRKAFRQRRRLHATQPSGTLRRSMASVVNLQACAGVETAFTRYVSDAHKGGSRLLLSRLAPWRQCLLALTRPPRVYHVTPFAARCPAPCPWRLSRPSKLACSQCLKTHLRTATGSACSTRRPVS